MSFNFYKQQDQMDCGPTCLRMIAKFHGRNFRLQTLRQLCEINKEGVSLLGISDAAEKIGFRSLGVRFNTTDIKTAELPCILHWRQDHFVVLHKIKNEKFYIADLANGLITLSNADFSRSWLSHDNGTKGIGLLISPTPQFFEQEDEKGSDVRWSFLFRYLITYRQLFTQLFVHMGFGAPKKSLLN